MAKLDTDAVRGAVPYVLAATLLAVGVGYLRSGTVGGGLAFGIAIGLGVAAGLVGYEFVKARRDW